MYKIYNQDNMQYETDQKFDLIYCDPIYTSLDFLFVDKYWQMLKPNGVFMIQTDDSTMAEFKLKLKSMPGSFFINTCIVIQEWGGVPRKGFPKKHDYIHIFSNGKDFKWYGDRVQIEKVTKNTDFDKKGTGLKTPCDVFYDLGNFSTMSKERVKDPDTNRNLHWQKSIKLMNRLMISFLDECDYVLDPFMGSGSTGIWCLQNNRNFIGIEMDKHIFDIADERLRLEQEGIDQDENLNNKQLELF